MNDGDDARECLELITILSQELGVALELSYAPVEMRELWGEALYGLKRSKILLVSKGLIVPAVVENVLAASESS